MGRGWGNVEIVSLIISTALYDQTYLKFAKKFSIDISTVEVCHRKKSFNFKSELTESFPNTFLATVKNGDFIQIYFTSRFKTSGIYFLRFILLFICADKQNIWHQINLQTFGLIQLLYWGTFYECFSIKNYSLNLAITFLQFSEPKPRIHFRQRCLNLFSKDISFELFLPWK